MPPGKRHFSRTSLHPTRMAASSNINSSSSEEPLKLRKICPTCINVALCDVYPLHIPIPISHFESHICTELIIAIFSFFCCFVQYFNIYQSNWWLPHSYPHYGLKLHLIDWFIVQFIAIMTLRPLMFSIVREYTMKMIISFESIKRCSSFIRMVYGTLVIAYGVYCGICVWWIHGFFMLLLLYSPWFLYAYLYSNNLRDFFDLNIISIPSAGFLKGILIHHCSSSTQRNRDEVDFLRKDFNLRMKCLLFNSFCSTYYCVYIPACFSQGYLYFENEWVLYFVILVWITSICLYLARYFPFSYYDSCHRAALHLGKWTRVNGKYAPCYAWVDNIFWYKGILVKHNGSIYKAENLLNSAEPGNQEHSKFYCCFAKPGSIMRWWMGMQISVVCLQFVFLLFSTQWNHVLASCLMLSCTYYTLYKCIKNYNLSDILYKLEDTVQSRMIGS